MALGDAILICLTEQPMSGYELARKFETSIGFFWQADHQQIYRELSRLRERAQVAATEIVQSGKPNKTVYKVTTEGYAHLRQWSHLPSRPSSVKDDLLVRLYALDAIDLRSLQADLRSRLTHHGERLARYEQILARYYGGAKNSYDAGKRLGLSLGLRSERAWVAWCEEALEVLHERGLSPVEAAP